ncbi:hypothetical protein [Streptomyces celluloflavus]|uniref:hypothetical protein n=1 Tax=Streptomyces celluloflavus TaxID=58344 RepID=UPI0036BA7D6E
MQSEGNEASTTELELRYRGLHLTVRRVPGALPGTVHATVVSALSAVAWFLGR